MCVRILIGCWMPEIHWMAPRCSAGALVMTGAVLVLVLTPKESSEERIVLNFFATAAFLGLLVLYLVVEFG